MTNPTFTDARKLVKHAREQIEDARDRITAYFATQPYAERVKIDPETGEKLYRIGLTEPLPEKVSLLAKDAVGNLRDALDYAVFDASRTINPDTGKSTGFPFAKNTEGVRGTLRGRSMSDVPVDLHDILISFKPHEGGNSALWTLNQIRNPGTHRFLVPAGHAIQQQHFVVQGDVGAGGLVAAYSYWDAANQELEYMRCGPGEDGFRYQGDFAFDIVFEDIAAARGAPAIGLMAHIADVVEGVVSDLEIETARITAARTG